MADSKQGGLDLVDQGTVFMLSLSCGLLTVALVYFACVWYRKRKAKTEQKKTKTPTTVASTAPTGRSAKPINRTFSRFSQVDEECTFYGDDQDLDLLKTYVEANQNKHNKARSVNAANQIKRSRSAAADVTTRIVPVASQISREHRKSAPIEERGYLETDL